MSDVSSLSTDITYARRVCFSTCYAIDHENKPNLVFQGRKQMKEQIRGGRSNTPYH